MDDQEEIRRLRAKVLELEAERDRLGIKLAMMGEHVPTTFTPQCPISCQPCDRGCGGNGCVILTGGKHIPDNK